MHSYEDDIAKLREQFALVNVSDPDDLRKWFAEHPYLTTNEHAQIADRSSLWVRRHKERLGIKNRKPTKINRPKVPRAVYNIEVPENWDTPEWIQQAIRKYPISQVAMAIGISQPTIYNRIYKYGLIRRPADYFNESKNPCCTRAWVYEHYVEQGLSQAKCAKLAGIKVQSFANWLNRFKIPVRKNRNLHIQPVIWQDRLIHQLRSFEIVNKIKHRPDHIHVRFRNYYWESYYYGDNVGKRYKKIPRSYIINETVRLKKLPNITNEFESTLDNPDGYPAHIMISPKEWQKASFLERRLALHQLTWILNRRGWVHPTYPQNIIDNDWRILKGSERSKYIRKNVFVAHPSRGSGDSYGFKIILHFFGLEEMAKDFRSPKLMMRALEIAASKKIRIDLNHIIRIMNGNSRTRQTRIYDPGVWRWMFGHLGITGTVLDLYPGHGHVAMACAAAGLQYTTIITPTLQKAIDAGFGDFLGIDIIPYDGRPVDCVFSNDDFKKISLKPALEYAKLAKRILHFVPRASKNAFAERFPKARSLLLKSRAGPLPPDYMFIL